MKHLHGSQLGILHFVFPCKKKRTELILAISLNHCMVSCSLSSPLKLLPSAENRQRNKIRLAGETPLLKVFYEPLWWYWHSSLFMWELIRSQSGKKKCKRNKGQALLFLWWSGENTMLIVSFYFLKQCLTVWYEHLLPCFAASLLSWVYVLPE